MSGISVTMLLCHCMMTCTLNYRIGECLGSGQFGTVNRGVWHTPSQQLEVAVKSLPAGLSENERVKFLQEAAITGQFKHPNIVRLHAIITISKPVSCGTIIVTTLVRLTCSVASSLFVQWKIVTELLHNGDLHQHLKSLRPV